MKERLHILKAKGPVEELIARFAAPYDKEAERKAAEWARKHVPPGYTCIQCPPAPDDPMRNHTLKKIKEPHALEYRVEVHIRPSFNADRTKITMLRREIAKLSPAPVQDE